MKRKDDNELVKITMGELRRLQKCDHEVRLLRMVNKKLHVTVEKIYKNSLDTLESLNETLKEIEAERENHGTSNKGRNGSDREGKKLPQNGPETRGKEEHKERTVPSGQADTGPEYPCS